MRMKVRMTFIEPWSTIINEVAKQCNMSVDEYCRRAVQVLTKQGLDDGGKEDGKSGSNDSPRDAVEVRSGTDIDSNALAHPENTELHSAAR